MVKIRKNKIAFLMVIFTILLNILPFTAFAQTVVTVGVSSQINSGVANAITKNFEITEAGIYSITVNAQTMIPANLTFSFDGGSAKAIAIQSNSVAADYTCSENITLSASSHSVQIISDGMFPVTISSLKLTLISATGGDSGEGGDEGGNEGGEGGNEGGNEGGEGGGTDPNPDTPTPPPVVPEETQYTIELHGNHKDTNITVSGDLSNWSTYYFVTLRSGKYLKYDLEATKGHYKVELFAGTAESNVKYTVTNDNNSNEVTSPIPNTGGYSSYQYHDMGSINLEEGINSITFSGVSGASWSVRLRFTKISDYVYYPIEGEKVLTSFDVDSFNSATFEDGVFTISDGGSVDFKINTNVDVFRIFATLCEESEASLNVYLDGELISTKTASEIDKIGDFIFESGEKTLTLEAFGGEIKLKDFTVKMTSPKEPEKTVIDKNVKDYLAGEDGLPGGQGIGYNTKDGEDPGKNVNHIHTSGDEWVKWEIDVPKAGDYLITIEYYNYGNERVIFENETSESTTGNVIVDKAITWTTTSQSQSGDLVLGFVEGKNIVKYTKPYGDLYLRKITFTLINYDMNVQALYVGGYPVLGNNTITPSADTMEIYMTNPVTTEEITNEISITDENGKSYAYNAIVSDGVVKLDLSDSLSENTKYYVSVKNLSCKYSDMSGIDTVEFTTSEDKSDTKSTLTIESYGISENNITVSAVINGSNGQLLDGRKVEAYIAKKGSSSKESLAQVVSKDGGKVIIDTTIDSDKASGTYTVYLNQQYSDSYEEFEVIFVNSVTKAEIASDFSDADTASEVKQAFSDNKAYISYNVESDVRVLGNKDAFYLHFKNYQLTDMNAFYDYYDKMYTYEKLKQNGAEFVFINKEDCDRLGVDYDKISLISENRTAFMNAVDAITEADFDNYMKKLDEVISEYLLRESKKEDVSLVISNTSVNYGQGFDKAIEASKAQGELKKVILNFDCTSIPVLNTLQIMASEDGTGKTEFSSNKAKIEFTYDKLFDKAKLFNVTLTAAEAGSFTLNYSGTLVFDYKGYEVETDITPGSFVLQVVSSYNPQGSDKTSGGGFSSGGSSSYTPSVTPSTPSGDVTETKEVIFDDIANYKWAEESIESLVNKGVISKAENKKFRPSDNITREEFVKMVVSLLNISTNEAESEFSDLDKNHWAYGYIMTACNSGIINGMGDGSFGVGKYITREQIAAIAARILDKYNLSGDVSSVEAFADEKEISSYAKDSVKKMKYFGIINGIGENTFAPKANATRAETAKIIYGLAKAVGL